MFSIGDFATGHPAAVRRAGRPARPGRADPDGPAIAWYQGSPGGDGILVHATLPVDADPGEGDGFTVVDLPEIEQAATIVHRGSMDDVMRTIQTLARWIEANGYRSAGYNRELYIEFGEDPDALVTAIFRVQVPPFRVGEPGRSGVRCWRTYCVRSPAGRRLRLGQPQLRPRRQRATATTGARGGCGPGSAGAAGGRRPP
jgi:GyrI-like small molecule binding domain